MERVLLLFPDLTTLADYVIKQRVNNAEVQTLEQMLIATMTDKDIEFAKKVYGAILKSKIRN